MKRTLSLALVLIMVLTMIPFSTFAVETQNLVLGKNIVELAGTEDGAMLTWTATKTGKLTITMPDPDTVDYIWEYYVQCANSTGDTHYGDGYGTQDGVPVTSLTVAVVKDEIVTIGVNITDKETNYIAGELVFTAELETALGSESEPIEVQDNDTTDGAVITADITVPANKTLYYSIAKIQNMILTVTGEGSFTVNYGEVSAAAVGGVATIEGVSAENPNTPALISVQNTGSAELSAQVKLTFPLGEYNNPEVIEKLGSLTAALEEGDTDGYYYSWTAEKEGTVSFQIDVPKAKLVADIVLTKMSNSQTASLTGEGVETVFGEELTYTAVSMEVAAGDVIYAAVSAIPVENHYAAMDVEFSGSFTAPAGTEDNPILLAAEDTLTVAVGATVYCRNVGNVNNMVLTLSGGAATVAHNDVTYTAVSGVTTVTCYQEDTNTPAWFVITNTDSSDVTYTVSFAAITGTSDNPAVLMLDTPTTATVEHGSNGYYYTWTATEAGTFTVAVDTESAENGWFYSICNTKTNAQTEGHTSASDGDNVTFDSVEVEAGHVIRVTVNTCGKRTYNDPPAGSVTITASFEPAQAACSHNYKYVDNCDGTHDYICSLCGNVQTDNEDHSYDNGACVCGAEEPAADDGTIASVVNQEVTTDGYTVEFTVETAGTLTVVISGTPGYQLNVLDADRETVGLPKKSVTGAEETITFDLAAGQYTVRMVGLNSDWAECNATISFEISFAASDGSGEAEKAEYKIDYDHALALGDNSLTLLDTAVTTIYAFDPTETGVYTFTAPEGVILGYWGAGEWLLKNPNSTTNTHEWTCTAVGQSAYIGVSGVEGEFNLNVAKTGDYEVVEIPLYTYENKATLSTFTLPKCATLGSYVNVYGDTQTAVLGDDGYYHLNSADGDILLIDMDYQDIILSAALKSDRPVMYAYVTGEDGKQVKYDIGNAVLAYEAVMDSNGYYPLTEDLIFFYDAYATGAGTWSFHLSDSSYNQECVWMYCCRTVDTLDHTYSADCDTTCNKCEASRETETAHTYTNGTCTNCGEPDPDYVAPIEKFKLVGANMELGNSLTMNFFINATDVTESGHYAEIEHVKADGTIETTVVKQVDWGTYYNMKYVSLGVFAKQMTEDINVTVFNAEGVAVSEAWNDSVEKYCLRSLNNTTNPPSAKEKTLYVDMLNYGAAAQTTFKYNTGKLANANLSEEQKGYATQSAEMVDTRVKGEGYAGGNLILEERIALNFFYNADIVEQAAYAELSYTDHYNKAQTIKIEEFGKNGNLYYVTADEIVVADCSVEVTCKLYDANGEVISESKDSVESYTARTSGELYEAIMKFGTSAWNYLH